MSDRASIDDLAKALLEDKKMEVHILVNNAGIAKGGANVLEGNLNGSLNLLLQILMRRNPEY